MLHRSMVLAAVALSSVHIASAGAQSVYVAPGGVYVASAHNIYAAPTSPYGQPSYPVPAPSYDGSGYVVPGGIYGSPAPIYGSPRRVYAAPLPDYAPEPSYVVRRYVDDFAPRPPAPIPSGVHRRCGGSYGYDQWDMCD